MKKILFALMIALMMGLSGCIWCDDCGHSHGDRGHHGPEYGAHHNVHRGGHSAHHH